MKPCLSDDILYAYLDGETVPAAAAGLSEHVRECAACAVRTRELGQVVELMDGALDEELPANAPTERLHARLEAFLNEASAPVTPAETASLSLSHFAPSSAVRFFEGLVGPFRRPAFASIMVVSIVMIVALAIGAWRSGLLKTNSVENAAQTVNSTDSIDSQSPTPDQASSKPATGEHTSPARTDTARPARVNRENRALKAKPKESLPTSDAPTVASGDRKGSGLLDVETAKHVEKAQWLFHSVIGMRSSKGKTVLNVAYEKQLSRRLLNNNTLLSRRAETQGNWAAEELLSRIEPFLLDIANLPDRPSPNELRLIKELMRGNISPL